MSASRVAVVTGSNRGIGLATVRSLCSKFEGNVYLTSRNEDRGQEAVKKIRDEGLPVKYHQLDIGSENSIKNFRDSMLHSYGGIDVLINNAGVKSKDTIPIGIQAKYVLGTNFFSTLKVSNLLLPHIKSNGRVVNIAGFVSLRALKQCSTELQEEFRSASITEDQLIMRMNDYVNFAEKGTLKENGLPGSAYEFSKLGVSVLSRIQARLLSEQGKNNILLNACCPGWVRTDMGGPKALKSPEEGAETSVYLALLPKGTSEPHGQYVSDKKVRR
ncbi:carbonyl reductase [NADPH] 1-like [Clavelina lepadiformis]|uniref:carbonyl reductase [NADPH] 1-like n=1 Tax=Clavelina lepadiformis TaxID=159417 RepID=UPI0040412CC5